MHSVLTVILFSLIKAMLMGHPSRMILQCQNTSGLNAIGVSLGNSCYTCSCLCNSDRTAQVPPYVGRDYYCETGYNGCWSFTNIFSNDPLWDGQQCVGVEAPCCTHPNMPWFTKTLGETTTEDIQLRLCNDHGIGDEETSTAVDRSVCILTQTVFLQHAMIMHYSLNCHFTPYS